MLKKIFFFIVISTMTWVACQQNAAAKNGEGAYRIAPSTSDEDVKKLQDNLLKNNIRLDFPVLQRDNTGKIQFIRCKLSSAVDTRKSTCESFTGFNYVLIEVSQHDLQCSMK
jgi:5-formyltetrahydrofolate cyclo-ligase